MPSICSTVSPPDDGGGIDATVRAAVAADNRLADGDAVLVEVGQRHAAYALLGIGVRERFCASTIAVAIFGPR